jgi:hypothetical protein
MSQSEVYNPKNFSVYSKILAAYDQYGRDIYNLSIKKLNEEFGEEVFPKWVARFAYEEPHEKVTEWDLNCELWKVTESFCGEPKYLGTTVGFEDYLTLDENNYFLDFAEALKYRDDLFDGSFKFLN